MPVGATAATGAVRPARPGAARRHSPAVPEPQLGRPDGPRASAASAPPAIAFLWPKLGGGFGSKITVGKVDDVSAEIRANDNFFYLAEGRAWLTEYPAEAFPKAAEGLPADRSLAGMKAGIVALYQKCPHLGCRVPNCPTSQWFECPCHGSQYNRVGEKKGRPGAARHGPLRRHRDRNGNFVRRHRHHHPRPARSARTPPARRPRVRTASPGGQH